MISVAVVGIEGSGKTVLATMLAKRYRERCVGAPFFEAMSIETVRLVEKCWNSLQNGEWPPSTPIGEMSALHWRIHFPDSQVCELQMMDAAGQDLRQLFGEQHINDFDALPQHLQNLARCVCQADIVLLLVNLGDNYGPSDSLRHRENEFAAKFLLDYLKAVRAANPPEVLILLTQRDLYESLLKQFPDRQELLKCHLPALYSAHLAAGDVEVLAVSAMMTTSVEIQAGRRSWRVPAPPFKSQGFSKLTAWLQGAVARHSQRIPISTQPPSQPVAALPLPPHMIWGGFLLLCFVCGWIGSCSLVRPPTPAPALPRVPLPEILTQQYVPRPGLLDDSLTSYGTVRNNGAAGKIRVIARVVEDGVEKDRQFQDLLLNPLEVGRFQIDLPGVQNLAHKIEVMNYVVVP